LLQVIEIDILAPMLDPIYLENDQVIVHAIRPQELERYETIIKEVYQIFSDQGTLEFLPDKRLRSVSDAENWLKSTILNFHCGNNFLHFITDKRTGKILGMVDLFAPSTISAYYKINQPPYFIEFYLRSSAKGKKIMSNLLPQLLVQLGSRGITAVGAVINNHNHAAQKVLLKAGFCYRRRFDIVQGLYQYDQYNATAELRRVG
jgi:RimJ/RimL family protein N-acetyltransferase